MCGERFGGFWAREILREGDLRRDDGDRGVLEVRRMGEYIVRSFVGYPHPWVRKLEQRVSPVGIFDMNYDRGVIGTASDMRKSARVGKLCNICHSSAWYRHVGFACHITERRTYSSSKSMETSAGGYSNRVGKEKEGVV